MNDNFSLPGLRLREAELQYYKLTESYSNAQVQIQKKTDLDGSILTRELALRYWASAINAEIGTFRMLEKRRRYQSKICFLLNPTF